MSTGRLLCGAGARARVGAADLSGLRTRHVGRRLSTRRWTLWGRCRRTCLVLGRRCLVLGVPRLPLLLRWPLPCRSPGGPRVYRRLGWLLSLPHVTGLGPGGSLPAVGWWHGSTAAVRLRTVRIPLSLRRRRNRRRPTTRRRHRRTTAVRLRTVRIPLSLRRRRNRRRPTTRRRHRRTTAVAVRRARAPRRERPRGRLGGLFRGLGLVVGGIVPPTRSVVFGLPMPVLLAHQAPPPVGAVA